LADYNELEQRFTISGGEVIPSSDQNPQDAIRFLKKRHFFTLHGVVVAPRKKYVDGLIKL